MAKRRRKEHVFLRPEQKHEVVRKYYGAANIAERKMILREYNIAKSSPYYWRSQGYGLGTAKKPRLQNGDVRAAVFGLGDADDTIPTQPDTVNDDRLLNILCEAQKRRIVTGSQADQLLGLWTEMGA